MADQNTRYWDLLKRVPTEHLKGFQRAGGFKGTAIKPMWTIQKMTEVFGPCGQGWGIEKPDFQLVPAGEEIMVYCTVAVWHGMPEQNVHGVGGDKVLVKQSSGLRSDDEAFKKAYTDALTNACKMLGAAADIHMGLWDGNKYADEETAVDKVPKAQSRSEYDRLSKGIKEILNTGTLEDLKLFWSSNNLAINALPDDWFTHLTDEKDEAKMALEAKAA